MLSSSAQVLADSSIKIDITTGYVAASASINLLVFWSILPSDKGALHSQQTEHKTQHTQRKTWHQERTHNLNGAWSHMESWVHESVGVSGGPVCSVVWLPTLHRPQHWKVIAVAHSCWVCITGSPEAGPVPGHLDDRGAAHTPNCAYFPSFHGHCTGNKNPSQNCHQEPPNLDYTNFHLIAGSPAVLSNFIFSFLSSAFIGVKQCLHPELELVLLTWIQADVRVASRCVPLLRTEQIKRCVFVFQIVSHMWVRDSVYFSSRGLLAECAKLGFCVKLQFHSLIGVFWCAETV